MPDEKTPADESVYRQAGDENEPRAQDPTDDHGTSSDPDGSDVSGTQPREGGGTGVTETPSTGVEGTQPTEGGG